MMGGIIMRKIIVLSFITLDGVMQAPGGPDEDPSNSFPYGGWSVPFWDDVIEKEMGKQMSGDFHLLLGRKTYDVFAANWPQIDPENIINKTTKYVVTHNPLPQETVNWKNSVLLDGDIIEKIKRLKEEQVGPDLQVHGSSQLIQTLLENDLVDEFWLKVYPITLGKGKRLFGEGTIPAAFTVNQCKLTPSGIVILNYVRSGQVQQGSF